MSTKSPRPNRTLSGGGNSHHITTNRIWERQRGETDKAFIGWTIYQTVREENLGGLKVVADQLQTSYQNVYKWAAKWDWVERYRAYENHMLLIKEREQQTALRSNAREWAKRRIDVRESGFKVGHRMIARAQELLDLPVHDREIKETVLVTQDMVGEEIETSVVLNFQQHPRDARMFADTGLKLMRLSADMSTENIGMLSKDVNLDAMTDEELDDYANKLLEIRTATLSAGNVPAVDSVE